MKMVFRWFGEGFDPVPLEYIRQIPGVSGVVPMLSDIPAGDVWPLERILAMKRRVEAHGLAMEVIESVNVHEDIKLGLPDRDQYISNYIATLENLGKAGVKVVCYNFMPVFDWVRTDLSHTLDDGSKVLYYDSAFVDGVDPEAFAKRFNAGSNGFSLPGWEPERLETLRRLFEQYKGMPEEELWRNLEYFLKAVIPAAERAGIKMAIHPDDPPWSVFGLLRIIKNEESLERLVGLVHSPSNGIALCSGALGADARNDIPSIVRRFGGMGRIPFAHVRNVMHTSGQGSHTTFYDAQHLSSMGSLDMYEIMRAYSDIDFEGYIRPDHGRMIWGESGRPGYGFYDRALGVSYLLGLWEALRKGKGMRA
ncbi:MAG: mannonate dehydratase [Rectinema sp.]|jgi:mannonate dehydratase